MNLIKISRKNIKLLNEVMDIIYDEWGSTFSSSKEEKLKKIKQSIIENKNFPHIYLLIHNDEIIGSFSILEYELKDSNLSPWLACVVINKKYRRKGYGKILLQYINEIIEKNFNTIYLTTELIGFYEKIDFKLIKIINNNGKNNRLYCKVCNK